MTISRRSRGQRAVKVNNDIIGPVGKVTDVIVDLGPRLIMAGTEVLGTSDNISIEVAETTKEELKKLKSANEIRLVKMLPDIEKVSDVMLFPLATRYQRDVRVFRYGQAGSDLKAGKRAYAHFPPPVGPPWNAEAITRAFWSDIRAKPSKGSPLVGVPLADVRRGQYCWLLTTGF